MSYSPLAYSTLLSTKRPFTHIRQCACFATVLFCLLGSQSTIAATTSEPLVMVYPAGKNQAAINLQYQQPVRLSQVIEDSLKQRSAINAPYWLGSSLTLTTAPKNKQQVIDQLQLLSQQHLDSPKISQSFANNAKWLQNNIQFTRLLMPVDIDQVRLKIKDNPLLTQDSQLILANRPQQILILGAIEKPTRVDWHPRMSAGDYLEKVTPLNIAENSNVTVIQPDGVKQTQAIAYWNKNHADIAPGATIYLGYESIFHDYSTLNNDMSSLLTNRTL